VRGHVILRRRGRLALILCLGIAGALVQTLFAHAELLRSEPAADAIVTSSPSRIRLTFSGPVDVTPEAIAVFDPSGTRVDRPPTSQSKDDVASVETAVAALSPGTHTVRWRVVSDDGHPIEGSFQFSVGNVSAATAPQDNAASGSALSPIPGRAMHLAALSAILGPIGFFLLVPSPLNRMRPRLWALATCGALALLPAAALMFLAQSSALSGSWDAALRWTSIQSLLATHWGLLWSVRTLLAIVLLPLAFIGWRGARHEPEHASPVVVVIMIAVGAALLLATAFNGHSAATPPVWLSLSVDWVHLAATTLWIGGIAALVFAVLPVVRALDTNERDVALAAIIPRFSTLALVCVELLVLTGFYHAWAHVDAPASLTTTVYGRTLLVKLALVAAMMLPAAINLLVLRPRLAATDEPSGGGHLYRGFTRTVGAELLLGVIVLVVVGRLTSVQPARAEGAPAPPQPVEPAITSSLTLGDTAGSTLVLLTVSPVRVGANVLEVELRDSAGRSPAPAQIRLRVLPPEGSGISPWSVVPAVAGNRYRASASLAPEGKWGIEVSVGNAAGNSETASFALEVPVRGARELLAAAADRMNRLRSAVEDVEMFADGVRTQATFQYQAPDRERWQQTSGGDGLEITIGGNRFTRQDRGWVKQAVAPVQWPTFSVHASSDDPVLIGRESIGDIDCFVVAYVDPSDDSRHRAWIATDGLLLIQHTSAAPGRVVTSRFSRFNEPLQIAAPVGAP